MSHIVEPRALPTVIERSLNAIRWRSVAIALVESTAIGIAVLVFAAIVSMTLDWAFTLSDTRLRVALTALSFGGGVGAFCYHLIPRLQQALRQRAVATRVDRHVPQLEERWSTVVEMQSANGYRSASLQWEMFTQVINEAVALAGLVDPRQISRSRTLKWALLAVAAMFIVLLGFLALNWGQTSVLLQRFLFPTTQVTATQLTFDRVFSPLPRGEITELRFVQSGLLRTHGMLFVEFESGKTDQLRLHATADNEALFVHELRASEPFRYRLEAGDAATSWQRIAVIDAPEFSEVELTIIAPEYAKQEPSTKSILPRHLSVLQGSRVKLRMRPSMPLRSFELGLTLSPDRPDGLGKTLFMEPDELGWYSFETQLIEDLKLTPVMTSRDGLTNELTRSCHLHVLIDKLPVARVVGKTEEQAVAKDDMLEFRFEAHDDFSVEEAELVIYSETEKDENGNPKVLARQQIDLGDQKGSKTASVDVMFDLKSLDLEIGENISYAVRVSDNREVELDSDRVKRSDSGFEPLVDPNGPTVEPSAESMARADSPSGDSHSRKKPDTNETGQVTDDALAADMLASAQSNSGREQPAVLPRPPLPQSDDSPREGKQDNNQKPGSPPVAGVESPDGSSSAGKEQTPDAEMTDREVSPNEAETTDPRERDGEGRSKGSSTDDTRESQSGEARQKSKQSGSGEADSGRPPVDVNFNNQLAQQTESGRRKLRIAERLAEVVRSDETAGEDLSLREWIVRLEERLRTIEAGMQQLVEHQLRDADRPEQMRRLDEDFASIETDVAQLREDTRDNRFAFVGLQMMEISRMHVTPARDFLFRAGRQPESTDSMLQRSAHHVTRARELLQALLKRYDKAERERKTAKALEEGVTLYEVYVEKAHHLMREATQNRNPLERKMAVIEVDQAYLERYAEVRRLRREMFREFSQLLADDPRLLSRFLGSIQRRRASLRNQLSELHERQEEIYSELSGWNGIEPEQRNDLWTVILELRLYAIDTLTKEISHFTERSKSQLPLILEKSHGMEAALIARIEELETLSREVEKNLQTWLASGDDGLATTLRQQSQRMAMVAEQIEVGLDRLGFEYASSEEVSDYVGNRRVELQAVEDLIVNWAQMMQAIGKRHYGDLVNRDQIRLTIATEELRAGLLGIEDDLRAEFQREEEIELPQEIVDLINKLQRQMETITVHQQSSTFSFQSDQLPEAEARLINVLDAFEDAEKTFDDIRRKVVEILDEQDVRDPNIADLEDPTLDRFLAQLEREPGIDALLGIPDRPQNLRELADLYSNRGAATRDLADANEEAMARAEKTKSMPPPQQPRNRRENRNQDPSEVDEDMQQAQQRMQEMLRESMQNLDEQLKDETLNSQQRERLQRLKQELARIQEETRQNVNEAARWQQFAEADQVQESIRAMARGEMVPDEQWNRVLSTLGEGLWQMKGDQPPEEYRKSIEQYQQVLQQLSRTMQEETE
ncbi:hypothetical protein [Rubinisphaera margarita]|uniref:hypothetical protein n=1 Tax=Rubinisphaera margarita TaxID=2909586 RepID=UPI001EE8823A|nr:hypothetical protein [Rubinisphaera margarita]MCG6155918.1 hypothetical protein [Rubinisphaera margarita]